MKSTVKELTTQGDKLFSERQTLMSLWQRIADNFYPERADFTVQRSLGVEFAAHLMTGWPVLMRRELANSVAAMLRPRGKKWFRARTDSEDVNNDPQARAWLDRASDIQLRVMYAQPSQFMRATKEGDNDFTTFGQAVLSRELMPDRSGFLFRCHHLRDAAWVENEQQVIDTIHLKWAPTARTLVQLFPKTVSSQVKAMVEKEPYRKVNCRRIVLPSDQYDIGTAQAKRFPFVSLYIDTEHDTVLEEVPLATFPYTIPRWVTVSGSQYAYSPATVVGLPDARLLQDITLTLLESGQKAVDPPMKATHESIIGGLNLQAGGVSWVDRDYDERQGSALEPAMPVVPRLDFGEKREERVQSLLQRAFFLDQIHLPDLSGKEMTAYETQKRVEEYIRNALPLFEPLETEYNGAMCEGVFEDMLRLGAFGSTFDMPAILRGRDVKFQFESPLQAVTDRAKTEAYVQASQLLLTTMNIDPTVRRDLDIDRAFRDALLASGAPPEWIVPQEVADQQKAQDRQAQQMQQQMQALQQGADTAGQVGDAAKSLQDAGVI